MPVIPARELGAVGIIKDNSPAVIPPNAFSDGINVRFTEKKVSRAPIFRTFAPTLTGDTPVWCQGVYNNQGGYDSLIYANNDGRLFQLANGTETDVTQGGHVNNIDPRPFTGCILSSCVYVNREDVVPRYLTPTGTAFANIPAWNANWRCASLRSYKSFLIALNVTKAGVNFPDLVKWSDVSANNAAPTSWDETDTTKLAGENALSQARTPIVDGGPLGENFIIYTHDEVWKMSLVGGQFIFDFQRLPFDNAGLINANCWIEIDGKHYAWSESDIYVHDGNGKQSIMDQRNRETFFRELNMSRSETFFMAHDRYHTEILFCGVSGTASVGIKDPNGFNNYAAVYNYRYDTWSFRDLPNASFAAAANANTVYTYANVPATLTYANVGGSYLDQEDGFSRFAMFTLVQDVANGVSVSKVDALDLSDWGKLALPVDTDTGVLKTAWVERTGMDLDVQGADLRSYKLIRQLMPLSRVPKPGITYQVEFGQHDMTGSQVTWSPPVIFDPDTQYKLDTRVSGRFLGTRFTMPTPNDFELAGYDLDVVLTGRR
jgi:hypothetical protein